jgi:hypothetical protein
MSIGGTWNVTVQSPIGERKFVLACAVAHGTMTGTIEGNAGARPIFEGRVDGDVLFWKVSLQQPMPMVLEFSGTAAGPDSMSGNVKFGLFNKGTFTASRA